MDLAKYRNLFLEESRDHLGELGGALLALEKDPDQSEAIDLAFRMAHSIKGMAGSLGYDSITEIAHRLEDRMEAARSDGRVATPGELALLFRGLDGLERMVAVVEASGEAPPPDPVLAAALAGEAPAEVSAPAETSAAATGAEPSAPAARAEPSEAGASPTASPRPAASPSVRVRTETLDRFLSAVGEVILTSRQARTAAHREGLAPAASLGFDRMDRVVGELQRRALSLRTAPLLRVMEPLPRLVRDLSRQMGKRAEVELRGAELELDRSILDRVGDPLVHLVRNAVDHGLESPERRRESGKPEVGRLVIDARREKDSIRISVIDDGAGIDLTAVLARAVAAGVVHEGLAEDLPPDEVAALVFRPGLSTKQEVSDISGRGVGMDAVKATIESLGGRVELESRAGLGTTTSLVVPISAAVQRVLLLGVRDAIVAVPISKVERIVEVPSRSIEQSGREAFALIDEEPVLVLDLAARLGLEPFSDGPGSDGPAPLVIAEVRGERVALRVGRLAGQQEIYVKPVPRLLASSRALAGLTVLGDGSPVFALDVNQLL